MRRRWSTVVPDFVAGHQYWRCPHCFRIWTTLKSAIEQHRETYAKRGSAPSALTHCPECRATEVIDLNDVLSSDRVDYYRCGACDCWWMVQKGKNGPATRVIFGGAKEDFKNDKAG